MNNQETVTQSEKAENVLEIEDPNDAFEFPYSKKSKKRHSKDSKRRPKSYRSMSKSAKERTKATPSSRNVAHPSAKGERMSNFNEDYTYKPSPTKNKEDYLSKVQQLIRNYNGNPNPSIIKSSSAVKMTNKMLYSHNTRMTIDAKTNEVKRFRPKKVKKEKEMLYDENLELKMKMNAYKNENIKLRTQLKQLQKEQFDNEAIVEEVLNSNQPPTIGRLSKPSSKTKESFLVISLKKQINELKGIIKDKETEISSVKQNYKYTRINELETDAKVYIEELVRLRNILDEVMKSKNPLANPVQVKQIEKEFAHQNTMLKNVQKENQELYEIIKAKDELIADKDLELKEKEHKIEKMKTSIKDIKKLRLHQRDKTKELMKARNELMLLKSKQSGKDKTEIDELLKSQQKQEISSKNVVINSLKSDKKKLSLKIATLSKQVSNLEADKLKIEEELKKEKQSKKYYEDLYKEEHEKNIDYQKQFKKSDKETKELDQKKHARPISANKHGRTLTSNLDKVAEEILDEKSELENAQTDKNDKTDQKQIPKETILAIDLKDATNALMTLRFELQKKKITNLKTYFTAVSMSYKEC